MEKDASIGGKMIRLSKVFPTLDCSSCITTPKMAAAAHHPNITLFTYCELQLPGSARATIWWPRFAKNPAMWTKDQCIGCRQCEYQCPVLAPDAEQGGFAARKAIYIPFSNAIPPKALIDHGKLHPVRPVRQDLPHPGRQLLSGAGRFHPDGGDRRDRHRF